MSLTVSSRARRGFAKDGLTPGVLQPIVLSDGSTDDTNDNRRDSQWLPAPIESDKPATATPTSCFGHFDRLDLEYTPKLKTKARIVVYHDNSVAGWSNTSSLTGAGISSRDFAARDGGDGTEERRRSKRKIGSISSPMEAAAAAAAAAIDEEGPASKRQEVLTGSAAHYGNGDGNAANA